jgi:hypothetical protein
VTKTNNSNPPAAKTSAGELSEGQRAYEAKRAAKAGMSLERWLDAKQKQQEAEARAKLKAAAPSPSPKKPGFFGRLIERASKPL